jgi:hypothetical protein
MQIPKAKEERPIPAYETRRTAVMAELREILGMSHLWVVDADGKRLEPKQEDPTQHPAPFAGPLNSSRNSTRLGPLLLLGQRIAR